MPALQVPRIFSAERARMRVRRARSQVSEDGALFILDDMVDDVIERLAFVRHEPTRALIIGDWRGRLADHLEAQGCNVVRADIAPGEGEIALDLEAPYPVSGFDFIAVLGHFDALNDVPGALIHIRAALEPRGLAIVSFVGGASLPSLRAAILAAEPDRPSARMHPLIDPRAAPGLMQRAGWNDPVVDTHALNVRYGEFARLVQDLREHGLTGAFADPPPQLNKPAFERARETFKARADADGKTPERFEIVTLTGRRSLAGT